MKRATEKSNVQFIPLNQLKPSPKNVRKVPHSKYHIKKLAASIDAHGQLQNIVVETEREDDKPTGFYLVTVGEGRRLAHLLRVKNNKIKANEPIACIIDDTHDAQAISLAENDVREAMHPADQFEAFKRLVGEGKSIEDVAAEFSVSPVFVKGLLKLANLAPEFIAQYRKGDIGLDVLKALALTDDHAQQRQIWKHLPKYSRNADTIKELLTKQEIAITDPIVKFVGVEQYEKAGGHLRHDWFAEDGDADYVMDVELLHRLATEKLEQKAAGIKAKGCAWVEVMLKMDYSTIAAYPYLSSLPCKITAEHRKAAGAVVSINYDGTVRIERELLKAEDAARFKRAAKVGKGKDKGTKTKGIHSAALVRRLTAHRTMGLQIALSEQPEVALVALTHRLLLTHFPHFSNGDSPVQISPTERDVRGYGADVEKSPARSALATLEAKLREELPKKDQELLPWLLQQPQRKVLELLAFCVALSVDGIQASEQPHPVDALARAASLDMRKWWKPTAETYFSAVPKARILEVVKEAVSPEAAATLKDLKKTVLAKAAEKRLNGTDWLPSLLRPQAH